MARPSLRIHPRDVTPEWLGAWLSIEGLPPAAKITAITHRENVGTGQMAQNVRFQLAWEGDDGRAPASVIGKFPSDDPTSRGTGSEQGGYRKEVEFYRQIAPTVDLRTPIIHAAEIDADTGDFVLLMEDLCESEQGDQLTGCSVDEAALAMDQAARLHAPRWGDPKLAGFDFLGGDPEVMAVGLDQIYNAVWPGFEKRYAGRLDPEVMALAERFRKTVGAWSHALDTPHTVTHGDFRLDNLLFGRTPSAPPLVVVDFQTAGRGYGAGDVSYFLGGSLPIGARRAEEERLVRLWWEGLAARGVEGYGWDACWRDYRHRTYGGVVMAVVASQVVVQTSRGDDMFIAMAEGAGRQAIDLEAERLLA